MKIQESIYLINCGWCTGSNYMKDRTPPRVFFCKYGNFAEKLLMMFKHNTYIWLVFESQGIETWKNLSTGLFYVRQNCAGDAASSHRHNALGKKKVFWATETPRFWTSAWWNWQFKKLEGFSRAGGCKEITN